MHPVDSMTGEIKERWARNEISWLTLAYSAQEPLKCGAGALMKKTLVRIEFLLNGLVGPPISVGDCY